MSKRNIQFSRPDEPAFLKKLKSKIGFKQNYDNIETKNQQLKKEDVLNDREEEEPVYVMNEGSHISERELETYKTKLKNERDADEQDIKDAKEEATKNTRIIFQKPTKKKDDSKDFKTTQSSSNISNKSYRKDVSRYEKDTKNVKSIKNTNLLSFGDEDEEEEA